MEDNPPITNTFGGFQTSFELSDFVLFGAPMDMTTSQYPGARFAPEFIRKSAYYVETYDAELDIEIEELLIHDLGDIIEPTGEIDTLLGTIKNTTKMILKSGKKGIMLGGEHTVTYASVRAFYEELKGDMCLIYFDAHFDLRDTLYGLKISHGTTLRRIIDIFPKENVLVIGIKAPSKEELHFANENSIKYITIDELRVNGLEKIIDKVSSFVSKFSKAYVSVDLDAFDLAIAPGVGNPEPDGLRFYEYKKIIRKIGDVVEIPFFDLVELNPLVESKITPIVATKAVFEYLFSQVKYLT